MIPESFIQELLFRVDIVDVIERYLPLKKAGANYLACCPFHSEKTPSFTVSPSKQFYHCFGCGAHGSAIGFVMQYAGVGFLEAVEELARQAGMSVPRGVSAHSHEQARQQPLTEYLARAAHFYREQLKVSPKAIDYLKGRGVSGEIAARFGLGYAPDEWQGLQRVFDDYTNPALVECGLVIENEQGRRYDRFRDRIVFPILDQRGNVIGFGGRVLGAGEPKYLNSPETALFRKGEELYGLPQARRAIHASDTVIVVEGYMDVIGLAQLGVENVVATLGTAATGRNVQKLLKLANRVVFCFDRDSAGDRAAWRAMEVSLEYLADGKSVEILQLPGELDPDEFIRAYGKDAFLKEMASAIKLSDFLLREVVRRNRIDLHSAEGRATLVREARPLLQKIVAPVLRLQLTKEIARRAQLTQRELESQCGLKPLARSHVAAPAAPPRPAPQGIERVLLMTVLHRPERAARLPLDLIAQDTAEGAALIALVDAIEHAALPTANLGLLIEHFRGSPHEEIIASVARQIEFDDEGELEEVFLDSIERLRARALARKIEELTARARAGTLSAEERLTLASLLARKNA